MKRKPVNPPIPSQVFSVLGPLPVAIKALEGPMGITNFERRDVGLSETAEPASMLQVYWHEVTHVALWDAGVHNSLSPKAIESICDAMGTYLAAAMRAGFLKVTTK